MSHRILNNPFDKVWWFLNSISGVNLTKATTIMSIKGSTQSGNKRCSQIDYTPTMESATPTTTEEVQAVAILPVVRLTIPYHKTKTEEHANAQNHKLIK